MKLSSIEDVKQRQKDLWFILVNGLRNLLLKTMQYKERLANQNLQIYE
jgi:hypothetical protein